MAAAMAITGIKTHEVSLSTVWDYPQLSQVIMHFTKGQAEGKKPL